MSLEDKIKHYISTLDLESPYLDDVWGNTDPEEWEEISNNGFGESILPNIPDVIDRLKASKILAKGTNWIAVEFPKIDSKEEKEQTEIRNFLEKKYKAVRSSYCITINDFK